MSEEPVPSREALGDDFFAFFPFSCVMTKWSKCRQTFPNVLFRYYDDHKEPLTFI